LRKAGSRVGLSLVGARRASEETRTSASLRARFEGEPASMRKSAERVESDFGPQEPREHDGRIGPARSLTRNAQPIAARTNNARAAEEFLKMERRTGARSTEALASVRCRYRSSRRTHRPHPRADQEGASERSVSILMRNHEFILLARNVTNRTCVSVGPRACEGWSLVQGDSVQTATKSSEPDPERVERHGLSMRCAEKL